MVDRIKGEEVEALYQEFVNDDKIDPNTAQKNISEAILQSPQFNLSEEEINAYRKKGPNKVFETFTTMKPRGKIGASLEGLSRGLAAYTPAGYAGLAAGSKFIASPLPIPPPLKIAGGIAIGLGTSVLTAMAARGITEAVLPEDPYLPDEKAYRTGGDTASAILNPSTFLGKYSVRGLLSTIPEDVNFGGNLIRARINPFKDKITQNLAIQNSNAKSSKVIDAVRNTVTTLPDELVLKSSQASATVRDLAQTISRAASKSAKNPKKFAIGETIFAAPTTIGAVIAEKTSPGEVGTRLLYETIGGGAGFGLSFVSFGAGLATDQARRLVTLLPDEIPVKVPFIGKKLTFVKNEKDRQAANYIINKLKDYAKQEGKTFDFDSFIKDLNQNIPKGTLDDLASLNLSPGLLAKEYKNPLIALERQLAANDVVFAKALKDQTDERLRAINATINTLYATGDDNALALASELYKSRVQTLLNAKLQRALDKTDKALEKFTNLPETEIKDKANRLLVQNINEVIKNWRKVEDGAWSKTLDLIGKEQIKPEDTLNFFKTVTDEKTGKAKINLSRYQNPKTGKLQGMDPYVINFVNKLRGGGKFTLNELKIDRSTILELSKREKNPTLRGFYGRLAENIYEDYTKPIPNMNPQAKVSFDQAKQISKVGNDLFKRTFITDATKQNVEGKSIVSPELLVEKAIFSGGSKARLNYEDLRQGFNVIGKLLQKEGQPITEKDVGKFVPDEEITDVMAMLNKETGYNQDYDTALNLILNDLLVKERVIKSIPVDTTFAKQIGTDVSEQEKITKKIIDPVKLEEFLNNDLTKVLLELSPFKTLEKDLRRAAEQGTDLQKSLNYLKKLVSQKSAQNTALAKALDYENPSLAIDKALNSPQPLEQFNFYADLINKAAKKNNDPTIKDAFTSYVIDYILTKSSDSVTRTVLPTPVKAYLNEPIQQLDKLVTGAPINVKKGPQTSILQVLKQKNLISDDYLKDLNKSITQLETIEDYLRAVLPESEFAAGGSMEFLGRFIGARVAPSGTIQIPAQFAKLGKQFFSDIPQAVLSSRLKESLLPGNIKEFINTIDKASEITKRGVGQVLADNFVDYFRRILSPSIRLPIQESSEEGISITSPASAKPIPKRKPPEEKVSQLNIPPRPSITAPPAQNVAQANLGPFDPAMAARFEQIDDFIG